MPNAHAFPVSLRKMRLVGLTVAALAVMAPSPPPAAATCETNANGVANSHNNVASGASTEACAPAWGQKAGGSTGRKAG